MLIEFHDGFMVTIRKGHQACKQPAIHGLSALFDGVEQSGQGQAKHCSAVYAVGEVHGYGAGAPR